MAEYRLWHNGDCIKEFEATEADADGEFKAQGIEAVKNMGRGSMTIVLEVKQGDEWVEARGIRINTNDLLGEGGSAV